MSPIIQLLPVLAMFFFLDHSIHTFAGNFPTPRSPIDSFTNYDHSHSGIHLVTQDSTHSTPKLRKLAFGRVNTIATGVIIVITILNIIVYRLRQIHEANLREKYTPSEQLCRRFLLADILLATKHFDDSLVLGQGGFGKVYKGVIDDGAITVAIKRLNPMSKQGAPEFWAEIEMLSRIRHSNIVSLIGYCDDCYEMILVYEYMVHGTLADNMHRDGNKSALPWDQRVKICIGAARGLDYLHTGTGDRKRIIHRDVKSSNILLGENWTAKISDFGLSKIGPANQLHTHVSTHVKGTFGYIDPEYFLTLRLTKKSDVYAFGVVLFEVLCGRRAVDSSLDVEQRGLAGWALHCIKEGKLDQIVDPSLRGQLLSDSLTAFAQIADQCLRMVSTERPTMAEVVVALEHSLTLQEREFYIVGEEFFNTGGDCNNQENADSFIKEETVINGACVNHENADSSINEQVVINATNDLRHVEQIEGIMQLDGASNAESPVTPSKIMLEGRPRPFPKFGEWDVNDPACAKGFTGIFNKARDEKKTGGNDEQIEGIMQLDGASNAESPVAPSKIMVEGRPLLKFGEWDVNDPASAEGFTVIFNKARDEKKTGGNDEQIEGIMQLDGASNKESHVRPARLMGLTKMVRQFFGASRVISAHSDSKLSKNGKSNNNSSGNIMLSSKDGDVVQQVSSIGKTETPNLKMFTFAELKAATRNFRPDMVLGEGRFGVVYKGWVDVNTYGSSTAGNRMTIAVRNIKLFADFMSEVEFWGKFRHPNLVKILGYCFEDGKSLLVYEYMQNGSLESHLFRKSLISKRLPWVTRLKIATEAARGLAFLHTSEKEVIYNQFKTSNILLDADFNAKLSDFELADLGRVNGSDLDSYVPTMLIRYPETNVFAYAAPEYKATGHLSLKSDVYGFGVVLLEILTGQRALDLNRPYESQNLVGWSRPFLVNKRSLTRVMDPHLEGQYSLKCAFKYAELVGKCVDYPKSRPSMEDVLKTLEHIHAIETQPDPSQLK